MILKKITTFGLTACIALTAASYAAANVPVQPERPDLRETIAEFLASQQQLVQERREFAESLRNKTVEDRRQAIEEYQAANADRVALHRALGDLLRERAKQDRPEIERPERPEEFSVASQPEISNEVQDLMNEFRSTREALIQERQELLASLRGATDEDRAEALAALREENAATAARQQELAGEIRDAVQDVRESRRND